MFEEQLRNALATNGEVTIFTLFGVARGKVTECHDGGWFSFERIPDGAKVNIYFEDVLLLEEHVTTH